MLKVGELNNEIIQKHCRGSEKTYFDVCERVATVLDIKKDIEKHFTLENFFSYFVPSFPILHNVYENSKKLPFACYILDVDDDYQDIIYANAKIAHLTRLGGGIGLNISNIRERGAKIKSSGQLTNGIIPFIKMFEATINAFNQGSDRKGSIAFYCDVDHPEILDFMKLDSFDGGDHNLKLSMRIAQLGVNISDEFMKLTEKLIETGEDQEFTLKSRAGEKDKTLSVSEFWETLINQRVRTGKPYIMFSDTVNNDAKKDGYLKDGEKITCPNLCTEVLIKTRELDNPRSSIGICCLGSLNLPVVKNLLAEGSIRTMKRNRKRLNDVISIFFKAIFKYSLDQVKKLDIQDIKFQEDILRAIKQKNIAIGCFGFMDAYHRDVDKQLEKMRKLQDTPDQLNKMFTNRKYAVAPTATTARIFTASPSIDNHQGYQYKYKSLAGVTDIEVDYLKRSKKENLRRFKTIDAKGHIDICAEVTKQIDQAVSCSLRYTSDVELNTMVDDIIYAWKKGLRTIYYCEVDSSDANHLDKNSRQKKTVDVCDLSSANCEACAN